MGQTWRRRMASAIRQGKKTLLCATLFVVVCASSATAAFAVDVPVAFENSLGTYPGVGHLNGNRVTATIAVTGGAVNVSGYIQGNTIWVDISGNFDSYVGGANNRSKSSSASPASGEVSFTWGTAVGGYKLTMQLPPSTAAAVGGAATPTFDVEPINQTYVAIVPAKVRERPDAFSGRIKTVDVGQEIKVVGKLKGQDWYEVSGDQDMVGFVVASQLVPQSAYHPVVAASAAAAAPAPAAAPDKPALPPGLADLDFGRYQALVIGNDRYENGLPALKTAAADAKAVAETLKLVYGFKVTLLVNASRAQIIGALVSLRKSLTWDDNLLIYYAGHGSYDQAADQGYWLPVDAAADDPTNWVSNTDLTNMLRAMQARHVLVVADSCYSGTLTRDANVQVQGADYIQRMVEKKARTVMTSGGLEPVADSGGGGHSVFATAFIAALRQNNGVMDGQSFFARVREPVVLAAPQTPEYANLRLAGHDGGDFVFVRKQ